MKLNKLIRMLFLIGLVTIAAPRWAEAVDCAVTNGLNAGAGSLRDCIDSVATTAGDTVTIPSGLTVGLTSGTITVKQSITIQGAGDGSSIIDGITNGARIFEIDDPGTPLGVAVTISGLTLQNGTDADGGAIYINASGALTINNSLFTMNHAVGGNGGAIYNYYGSLIIENSAFILNDTDTDAGAINNDQGTLKIFNGSLFDQNTADGEAGAIDSQFGVVEINDTIFTNNSADSYGAVLNDEGSMTLTNCTIGGPGSLDGNTTASGYGAGLSNYYGTMTVENSTIAYNMVTDSGNEGGGIYSTSGFLTVNTTTISNNTADYGAGIYTYDGGATISNSTISDNVAPNSGYYGGGIYCYYPGGMTITNTTISNNSADYGGGIYNYFCAIVIDNSTLSNNHATDVDSDGDGFGGGILNDSYYGGFVITNSTFNGNTAALDGGGIYTGPQAISSYNSTLDIRNSTFSGNMANNNGGAIYNDFSYAINFNNVTIAYNSADADGDTMGDGGGIFNDNNSGGGDAFVFSFSNTIVANNTDSGAGPDCFNDFTGDGDTLTSRGNNLIGDPTGCEVTGDLTGNLTGDPGLAAALAMNGGPTETLALLLGSQAIGAGNNSLCEETDQRGTVRPQDVNCDIGAFEAGPSADLSSTQLVFGNQPVGSTSPSQTVTLANNGTVALTINSITLGGADMADFAQTNDCGGSVAVGDSCDIEVTFGPTAVGTRLAEIIVDSSANSQLIALIGVAVAAGGCTLNSYATPTAGYPAALALALIGLVAYGMIRKKARG